MEHKEYDMMEIKILGTGCPKCKRLTQLTHEALEAVGTEATIVKVTDLEEIMAFDVMATPGLVIDGQVVSAGRLPRRGEIESWLREASSQGDA
ncbi:MAG: thioredoxin family protein [Anaerolineae bacterium]